MNSVTLLIKPASALCNMRCRYCFYANVSDMRQIKNFGLMTKDTAEMLIKRAFALDMQQINFAFQGGEPTLWGLENFVYFTELVKKHNKKNILVGYALQTNGLLIAENWAKFFFENKFLIGLSLDGVKDMHDLYRVDASGKGTHAKVMQAARTLKKHSVDFNILTVVNNITAKNIIKIYSFFKSQNFKYLQFIPCLNDFDFDGADNLTAENYEYFLKAVFDAWYADYQKGNYISVRHIDNYIYILKGYPPENCAMGGKCGISYTVEANGNIYPCDFYCIDKWKLTDLSDERCFTVSQKQNEFIAESMAIKGCAACKYYFICRGGCRRDREPTLASNKFCAAYKSFFDYALERMKKIPV